tara:strand:+ start:1115 stop:1303 length:189 start_codon:yes stop_codon:yes gene_type:complete
MSYSIVHITKDTPEVKIYGNGKRSCIGKDSEFQQWLRANKDNLPADIQAEVDAGRLVIEEAD